MQAMKTLQVRDVPDEAHAVLRRRAAAAGQSLQEYVRALLVRSTERPTVTEVMERAGRGAGGRVGFGAATEALRGDRDGR